MTRTSTKAAGKKGRQQPPAAPPSQTMWWIAASSILLTACLLRLAFLNLKPLHHDEGVNGYFLTNLFRTGYYHYDPANYHGPTLYYFGLITTTLNAIFYGRAGLSTFAIRLVPAIFGAGTVWLALLLRRNLGTWGAWAAAALLAVSPGMMYFSRYFIHEIPFVFFTLALVIFLLRYRETGQPRYLLLSAASAALMFATKETCIISFAVLLLAWLCCRAYLHIRNVDVPPRPPYSPVAAGPASSLPLPAAAVLVFIGISVLFFSSFFTNWHGVLDSLLTFKIWTHTGVQTDQYRASWSTYWDWLVRSRMELPVVALGAVGIIIALWKARNLMAVFTAFWALGISAAYSLVPYKTPWLALNLILPLAIMAGYAVGQCYEAGLGRGWRLCLRISAIAALAAAIGFSGYQAVQLSFYHYDDNSFPYVYVYAHSSRQLIDLADEVESIAAHNPAGKNIGITIASAEYWPLPWYLRDYPHAAFWGHMVQPPAPVLIVSGLQTDDVDRNLNGQYVAYKAYELRPGNLLVLYLKRGLQP